MIENYRIIRKIYTVYIALLFMFAILIPSYSPTIYHVLFQLFQATSILMLAYFVFQKYRGMAYFMFSLIFYLCIMIGCFRLFNISVLNNWLGMGVDGWTYTKLASEFVDKGYSWMQIFDYFEIKKIMLDDYGMFFITTSFFTMWGTEWGFQLLPFLGVFPIVLGGYLLKLLAVKIGLSENVAYLLFFLWSTMTYACYNSSVGLKENYMVFWVILAIYVLQLIVDKAKPFLILTFLLIASIQLFFRMALFYMLTASLIVALLMKIDFFVKNVWICVFCCILLSIVFFAYVVNYLGGMRGGYVSSQFVGTMYETKTNSGGIFGPFLNVLVTFIGPIPSFISDAIKVKYMTLFSFTSTIKLMLSFGYLYSIVIIFLKKMVTFLPLLTFVLLHSVMIWIMFYSLHDRYQWPQYPFVLLLALYGLEKYEQSSVNMKLFKYYSYFVIACILFFNFRVL